jgi:hypothetical protein
VLNSSSELANGSNAWFLDAVNGSGPSFDLVDSKIEVSASIKARVASSHFVGMSGYLFDSEVRAGPMGRIG